MNRRLWRFVLAGLLVAGLVAVGLSMGRPGRLESVLDASRFTAEALPQLLQRIRNFHRVITREGRKVLEVSASEASYYKNDKAIEIIEPKVVFYEGGERAGEVAADKGRLYLDGTDVQAVEVMGKVRFELGRLRLEAENLSYERATNRILVRGRADLEAAEMSLSGTDLTIDMVERHVVMNGDVSMTLRPRDGGQG
ncbi:MAG TPA: LPS export ABC transporter periplasmic protein LptC [Candidatus Limnocylindrales bacterium]|nr:LPS export ABC transporter periplasmic protein LptC [Candidatus Limnocylindrales bacterium]